MHKFMAVMAGLFLAVLVAGCGGPSTEDATAQMCTDIAQLGTSLSALENLNADSTIGEIRDARDSVSASWDDVKADAATVTDARVQDLETAYNNLVQAIDDIPETATLQEARDSIQEELIAVQRAREELRSGLNCQ